MAYAKNNSQKRIRPSIKKDPIDPVGYMTYKLPFACEDCSHFSSEKEICTFGYITTPHLRRNQEKSYLLSVKMTLCRFIEID